MEARAAGPWERGGGVRQSNGSPVVATTGLHVGADLISPGGETASLQQACMWVGRFFNLCVHMPLCMPMDLGYQACSYNPK